MSDLFTLRGLTFTYPGRERPALDNIHLAIPAGQFVTLCGHSGCGKTTLLRHMKPALAPHGTRQGDILFLGAPLEALSPREQAAHIGFVMQSPENQVVTHKVWHELAFGLESLGLDTPAIRRRVAEMAAFFGIESWFHRAVDTLSGGQKQLLSLAAVMVMQPRMLLLDEPTGQLDPIAAGEYLAALRRVNEELGVTVVLSEHRLEEALPLSHRVLVLEDGRLVADGPPGDMARVLEGNPMFAAMPTPMRVWAGLGEQGPCPVTVRAGRDLLAAVAGERTLIPLPPEPRAAPAPPALEARGLWFGYEDGPHVLRGLDLTVPTGSLTAIMGGNGAGKSTLLALLAGVEIPRQGEIQRPGGPIAALPQNPQALFVGTTVAQDLQEAVSDLPLSKAEKAGQIAHIAGICQLEGLLERHPYDLSGGEQQRAALAKVLLRQPKILLLDEPTKGLDARYKARLAGILARLRQEGATVVLVSHDVEFCARYADRCALMFDGAVVSEGPPRDFFAGNGFYTTAAARMARGIVPDAVTAGDILYALGAAEDTDSAEAELPPAPAPAHSPRHAVRPPLSRGRKGAGAALLLAALAMAGWTATGAAGARLIQLLPGPEGWGHALLLVAALVCALSGAALLTVGGVPPAVTPVSPGRTIPPRTLLAAGLVLLLIPLTLWAGAHLMGGRRYYFVSLLVVLEAMVPFFLVFEGRRPQARELVVLATLCALCVAGRAAFFFLPQFKPVAALVIVSAAALGAEAGFLVGAVSMLASNVFFGQGPFTPFQMFAMGLVGFLAGILFRRYRGRGALCVYGGLATFALYGFIMNTYTVFQTQAHVTWGMVLSACLVGAPMDAVHGLSTVFFLWVAGPGMLGKLERIKTKYGFWG